MINKNDTKCPKCGGKMQPRGYYWRKIQLGNNNFKKVKVKRFRCNDCGSWHGKLPDDVLRYKRYSKAIIEGFNKGKLNTDMLEYENFPCDITVKNWLKK